MRLTIIEPLSMVPWSSVGWGQTDLAAWTHLVTPWASPSSGHTPSQCWYYSRLSQSVYNNLCLMMCSAGHAMTGYWCNNVTRCSVSPGQAGQGSLHPASPWASVSPGGARHTPWDEEWSDHNDDERDVMIIIMILTVSEFKLFEHRWGGDVRW